MAALMPEEAEKMRSALLSFVERVSRGGFEVQGEEFLALPEVVRILLDMEGGRGRRS